MAHRCARQPCALRAPVRQRLPHLPLGRRAGLRLPSRLGLLDREHQRGGEGLARDPRPRPLHGRRPRERVRGEGVPDRRGDGVERWARRLLHHQQLHVLRAGQGP